MDKVAYPEGMPQEDIDAGVSPVADPTDPPLPRSARRRLAQRSGPADVSTAEPGTLVIEVDFAEPIDAAVASRFVDGWTSYNGNSMDHFPAATAVRAKVKGAPDWQARAEA